MRRQNWARARERLYRFKPVTMGGKRRDTIASIPCVELMKVHGSINLFRSDSEGALFENDFWTAGCPTDYTPMIAPPGDAKTQEALNFHERLFGEALRAIDKATAFLVVGYGFRDDHIHQKILKRVREGKCPLIALTLNPSAELKKLPSMGKNVWVVTGAQNQAAGGTDQSGTRFANRNETLSGDFDGVTLWRSDEFARQILGG